MSDRACLNCSGQGRFKTGWDCVACNGTGKSTLIECSRIDHRGIFYEMFYGCWKCAKEREEQEEEPQWQKVLKRANEN